MIRERLHRELDVDDLFLILSKGVYGKLINVARRFHTGESQIISHVIGACEDLLKLTKSETLRYERLTSNPNQHETSNKYLEQLGLARDLKARIAERQRNYGANVRQRHHFSIPRETKRRLRTLAAYHNSTMSHVVETLLALGLPIHEQTQNERENWN